MPHYHMSVGDVQSVITTHTAAIQALSHSRCVERHKLMGDGWDLLKGTPLVSKAWGSLCDPEELVEPPTSPISSAYTADLSLLSGKWKLGRLLSVSRGTRAEPSQASHRQAPFFGMMCIAFIYLPGQMPLVAFHSTHYLAATSCSLRQLAALDMTGPVYER